MSNILYKKLPPNMQTQIWIDFMNAVETESSLMKEAIYEKGLLYDLDSATYDQLLELSVLLGVPVDVSVDSSKDFLINELKSIPFRIKWKATVKLYKSFFPALDRVGCLFLYYWSGADLIRHSKNLLGNIAAATVYQPYKHESVNNFTGTLTESYQLDTELQLDTGWFLDSATSRQNTKHIAMEYFIDRLITVDSVNYLMTPEYYSYISTNMDSSKKVTEVLHVGSQLTAIGDNSHVYNSSGLDYTMPSLQLNCVTTTAFSSITDKTQLYYIEFGIGTKTNLPASGGSGTMPTALTTRLARVKVLADEQYIGFGYYGACAQYMGNLINNIIIGTGDGTTTTFTYTLPYCPIKPLNVKLTFISNLTEYTVEDNGYGVLKGTNGDGTVDYTTGAIVFNTEIYYDNSVIAGTGNGSTKTFTYTPNVLYTPLKQNSTVIKYIISGTLYVATDTPTDSTYGTLSGQSCTGTINYVTGQIDLTFASAPANETTIQYSYKFKKTTVPDSGTKIVAEYYFTSESVEITETGLTDSNGNLLAYATFPPVKFKNFKNHLNFAFVLKQSSF